MKKFVLFIVLIVLMPLSCFAQKSLTVGDALTLYLTELFPNTISDATRVSLKYTWIGNRNALRLALQKGIYYGIFPNQSLELNPDREMTERYFSALLVTHFGITMPWDRSGLTLAEYHERMKLVRESYAYRLLHLMNTPEEVEQAPESPTSQLSNSDHYHLLNSIYSLLVEKHIFKDSLVQKNMIYAAVEWLVNEVWDEHTKFYRPAASTDFRNNLDGNIVGIWVIVDIDSHGVLLVTDVIPHSPAERSGMSAGDIIIKIDGKEVDTSDGISDDINRLRGTVDTQVEVTVRSWKLIKSFLITRELVKVPIIELYDAATAFRIVFWEVTFGSDVLMLDALRSFIRSGKKRLILDLRNNPGWSMAETRSILNYFIDAGNPLFSLKYTQWEVVNTYTDRSITDWSRYEIVILINENTASSAEIIATTLREYFPKNAVIVGKKSYGKWTVQELVTFDDKSLLKYTIAEWLTPIHKKSVHKVWITPDVDVIFHQKYWKIKKIDTQLMAAENYSFAP